MWGPCKCGNPSIASMVDHSCPLCFSEYSKCPDCAEIPSFIRLEDMHAVEESLAEGLKDDGPWMI